MDDTKVKDNICILSHYYAFLQGEQYRDMVLEKDTIKEWVYATKKPTLDQLKSLSLTDAEQHEKKRKNREWIDKNSILYNLLQQLHPGVNLLELMDA